MKNIGRDSLFTNSFTVFFTFFLNRGACFTFLIIPAMFFSCVKEGTEQEVEDEVTAAILFKSGTMSTGSVSTLDVFIFEPSGTLDCYQRIPTPSTICEIASGSGTKQLLLIANSQNQTYEWTFIRNLYTMADILVDLELERHEFPLMTSLIEIKAGENSRVELFPIRSEITINSLKCDFSKEVYHNESFTDVKMYLTNVNASCSLVLSDKSHTSRIINTGMLDTSHLKNFKEADLIVQSIDDPIGKEASLIQKSLFCYANQPEDESIGSPMTKLVIEGKIGKDTYYYPIKINPQGGGVARGCKYIFDIVLTRSGVTDPDGELSEKDVEFKMEIEGWKEKDGYKVRF